MGTLSHPELAYSFRRREAVVGGDANADPTLGQVEALLLAAGAAYAARKYGEAIDDYQQARSLLWQRLFPTFRIDEARAWSMDLIEPLVSYGAEWLNVLAVAQPAGGVRPRIEPSGDPGPQFGLTASVVDGAGGRALADLQAAQILVAQGNTGAAAFFQARAAQTDPTLIKALGDAGAGPAGPSGSVPAAPGGAAIAPPAAVDGPVAAAGGLHAAGPARHAAFAAPAAVPHAAALASNLDAAGIALAGAAPAFQALPAQLAVATRTYTTQVGDGVASISWAAGGAPAPQDIVKGVYEARRSLTALPDVLIRPQAPSDAAMALAHAWYYETALGLAECYHATGDWADAETWYTRAAGYAYLNTAVEAPYVWSRLAALYRDWGDALFRADDAQAAVSVYEHVVTTAGGPGTSALYSLAGLQGAADQAREVITNLAAPLALNVSPAISGIVLDVWAQLTKIAGGLDFFGHWAQNVPIWTFDYLQSVATNLCQLAIGTERDAMTYWEKADAGTLTRLQLSQSVALANAERDAAQRQVDAAGAELGAYAAAASAAGLRAADARANAQEYAQKADQWTMHQALQAQLGGGQDGDAGQLNDLADQMIQGGYSLSGDRGTLAAAEGLTASRLQSQYEIDQLNRTAVELDAANAQAAAEQQAAQARVNAATAAANAAAVRANAAAELAAAFDAQTFTPDVWHALGQRMSELSQRYLTMAVDIARRMQRAYNFENDAALTTIRGDYSSEAINGMLAADSLMADIGSFTWELVTSTTTKAQPVKQTISLAQRYPFQFETQFRATGKVSFATSPDDFDAVYPGAYAGRIERVEVAVDGIVPASGISGTLTNDGLSHYRLPSAAWQAGTSGLKHRVQPRETLVLSDYDPRADALIASADPRQRRVFEGAGVVSSWTLDLPPSVNQLDYDSIVDVRMTFTYAARYDPDLAAMVLADLASRPSAHERQRPYPLRWLFPDGFFAFYETGILDFALGRDDFGTAETLPVLTQVSCVVVTTPRARAQGVTLTVTPPAGTAATGTTDADGVIASAALAGAAGGTALGAWRVALTAAANPSWVTAGSLALDGIANVGLVLGYSFTPRA